MKSMFLKKINDEKGQNLVEFALILLLFFTLLFGIIEFGRYWWRANMLKGAANIAARTYAVQQVKDEGAAKQKAEDATGGQVKKENITITPSSTSVKASARETFRSVFCPQTPPPGPQGGFMAVLCGREIKRDVTYRLE